jgi:hypothetical protein
MLAPCDDWDVLSLVAQQRHDEQLCRAAAIHQVDPFEVGRVAAKLAARYYQGDTEDPAPKMQELARRAGVLLYAHERWGYSFEDVIALASFPVARVVAALSGDPRLPSGPRLVQRCAVLQQAGALAQIVKLAEVLVTAVAFVEAGETALVEHAADVKQWAEEALKVLDVLTQLRDHERTAKIVTDTKQKVDRLFGAVEAAKKAQRLAVSANRLAARAAGEAALRLRYAPGATAPG